MTIKEMENSIIKKTNKYVYFSDNTHMSFSDFHILKNDIRKECSTSLNDELKDSVRLYIANSKTLEELEKKHRELEENMYLAELNFDYIQHQKQEPSVADFTKTIDDLKESLHKDSNEADVKLRKLENLLYEDFDNIPMKDTCKLGIKFILQQHHTTKEFRFRYDPYQVRTNNHSDLSNLFIDQDFGTVSGGWITIKGNNILLDRKSGDYGCFDEQIAYDCAKKLFKEAIIVSNPFKNQS